MRRLGLLALVVLIGLGAADTANDVVALGASLILVAAASPSSTASQARA
jgi:hypothetical protein